MGEGQKNFQDKPTGAGSSQTLCTGNMKKKMTQRHIIINMLQVGTEKTVKAAKGKKRHILFRGIRQK